LNSTTYVRNGVWMANLKPWKRRHEMARFVRLKIFLEEGSFLVSFGGRKMQAIVSK
jgi:hypothetical protein